MSIPSGVSDAVGDVCGGGGRGAAWAPPPDPPTHPRGKNFPQEKKIYHRGPEIGGQFWVHKFFFWHLTPTPFPLVYVTVATTPWPGSVNWPVGTSRKEGYFRPGLFTDVGETLGR